MINPCILTGYDEKYEAFASYWLMKIRRNSEWPVFVCDFGFSESHRKWLEDRKVTVYKSASTENGWFLKPFAILDCPARFGVYIDIDAEAMLNLDGFRNYILPGIMCAAPDPNDIHYYTLKEHLTPLNSGVICFDNESKPVKEWCEHTSFRGEWTFDNDHKIRDRKGDQGVLNIMVPRDQIQILPREFNWFEDINNINAELNPMAVIWHHLGPVGKSRFMMRSKEKSCFIHW